MSKWLSGSMQRHRRKQDQWLGRGLVLHVQGRSKPWKTGGAQSNTEGASLLGDPGTWSPGKFWKFIVCLKTYFLDFKMSYETKSECLKLVKYFPFLRLRQFAERGTFFSCRLYYFFRLESVTKCKVKINQRQQTPVACKFGFGCCVHEPSHWHYSSHKMCGNKTFLFRVFQNYPAQNTYPKYPCNYLRNLKIRLVSK